MGALANVPARKHKQSQNQKLRRPLANIPAWKHKQSQNQKRAVVRAGIAVEIGGENRLQRRHLMEHEVISYLAMFDVAQTLQEMQLMEPISQELRDRLALQQRLHVEAHKDAYGTKHMKPKHHCCLHILGDINHILVDTAPRAWVTRVNSLLARNFQQALTNVAYDYLPWFQEIFLKFSKIIRKEFSYFGAIGGYHGRDLTSKVYSVMFSAALQIRAQIGLQPLQCELITSTEGRGDIVETFLAHRWDHNQGTYVRTHCLGGGMPWC